MKLGFSQQEIINTAKSLGLPSDGFVQRRVARAIDILESNKVNEIDDGIFRVHSQYDENKSYIVNVNHGQPYCDCPDGERTINCKHRIASLLYAQRQAQEATTIIKTTDGNEDDYWRRSWLIAQGNIRTVVYEERDRRLFCNCGAYYGDCEHKQLVIKTVTNELKQKRIVVEESTHFRPLNECGSNEAKALQDQMNGQQLDSRTGGFVREGVVSTHRTLADNHHDNGNGAYYAPSQIQLDISDPFQLSELLDIGQIEGKGNGDLVHRLNNGEYVISYRGIMSLSAKHDITFETAIHDDHTAIAKGHCGTSERVSGKPINGNANTALELAKRNAARQLLPYAELRAVEKKAQLESEFDWKTAYQKCANLTGGKAQVDVIINDLVNWGKLRKDNPSHYDRTEWLLIHEYCQKEASIERDPGSTNNWSYNSAVFLERCREAIDKVRDNEAVDANELPPMNGDKRKLQMDKKLRTWLVESDGTKTEISCREICEKFESKQNPSIVTRLRAGIDDGADISTVELDN